MFLEVGLVAQHCASIPFFYVLRSDPFYFKFFIEKAGINILFLVGKHKE